MGSYCIKKLVFFVFILSMSYQVQASNQYTPSDVFGSLEYSNRLVDSILQAQGIGNLQLPTSRESDAKPMHVYELQASVLAELYEYTLGSGKPPPPRLFSTPIEYSPTSVYFGSQILKNHLEFRYRDTIGYVNISPDQFSNKSPSDVYGVLLNLFYKLNRLNGNKAVSPNVVYAHTLRANKDLQNLLLTLSQRMPSDQETTKRALITAKYGMHPDGSRMASFTPGKSPGDVLKLALDVRNLLNDIRKKFSLAEIDAPAIDAFGQIQPIDVFAQTQFIIAEINLLKMPLQVHSATPAAEPAQNKTPSDVFYQMQHVRYMLDRLLTVSL